MADGNGQQGQAGSNAGRGRRRAGGALTTLERAERLTVATSALLDRMQLGARLGEMYGGERNIYDALGWKRQLTWDDLYDKYRRQDIAAQIVDLPVDDTWSQGFTIEDDPDPAKETNLSRSWQNLEDRLRLSSWMHRVDSIAGIGEYAVMYLGVRGQLAEQPLTRAREGDLVYVSIFRQPNARFTTFDENPTSERFGLPESYQLTTLDYRSGGFGGVQRTIGGPVGSVITSQRSVIAHWSRVIHVADTPGETKLLGRPRLERVYNLLDVLLMVTGASGEAYWRGARPRYHLNVQKEFAGALSEADRDAIGEELTRLIHGWQDFLRTSGADVQQLIPAFADPRGAVDVIIDLIAAAAGIPKRILLGSERGELASSQDAIAWAGRVKKRQKNFAEPEIVRPLVDRLIGVGILPQPTEGQYQIRWGDIAGPTAMQRAELAERIAKTEAAHAQAEMLGKPAVSRNELREIWGYNPVKGLDEDYPGQIAEEEKAEREEQERQAAEEEMALRQEEIAARPEQPANDDQDEDEDEELEAAAAPTVNRITLAWLVRVVNAATDAIFRNATRTPVIGAALDLMRRTAERFGLAEVDPASAAARRFIADYGADRVRAINDTTREALRKTLTEGIRRDETQRQFAARVRKVFRDASAARARLIAATETHRAAVFGALEGMAQAGVELKTWNTQRDEKVRPLHVAMDGQVVPIGEPFVAPTGEMAPGPGLFGVAELDVGCRCYPTAAAVEIGLPAAAQESGRDPEFPLRQAAHMRRMRAAVRRALREQLAAVLAEMARDTVRARTLGYATFVTGKASQDEAGYVAASTSHEKCADCAMFMAPNACTAVDGTISEAGWCRFFEAKEE